jgi:HEPN domain-containing protein
MKTNFSQGKSWIVSAISDLKIVVSSIQNEFYSLVAFRSQLAVEKFNKAILNFMGLKVEKTYSPTVILEDFLKNKSSLTIALDIKEVINDIIKYSKFFENEGVQTRYGTFKNDKLITAEEIYKSFEDVKDFLINLERILNLYLELLKKSLNLTTEGFKDLGQLELLLGELKKWT